MKSSAQTQFLLASLILAINFPAQAVSVSWGALATSSITECADIFCATILTESEESAGENMDADAMTELNDVNGNSSFAQSTLSGTAFTPTLSVFAGANSDPNLVFASASGVQGYTNNGLTTTITVDLSLTANEVSAFGSPTPFSFAAVNAFAVVFLDTDILEITEDSLGNAILGTGFENSAGSALLAAPVGNPPDPQATSFSFEVLGNQNFLIWAGLQAVATSGGVADARGTLILDLRDDTNPIDLDQFSVASQSVGEIPIPAAFWLFGTALIGVVGFSKRRKAA